MKALISIPDRQTRPSAIEKSLFAMARAKTHPHRHQRTEIAQRVYADDKIVAQIIERGMAPVGTTTGDGWASQVSQNLVGEFLSTLAPLSAAAQIMAQGVQVRLAGIRSMKLPAREGGPSTAVSWVAEAEPIPVRTYTLNDDCELEPRKFGFIIGISNTLAKRGNGEAVIRQLIREDAAATLDAAYFSAAAGDSATHAGMLNGVAPFTGYAGGDREAMEIDLAALSDVVSAAGSGQVTFVVSPRRAARIRIKAPDLSRELTILPSLSVADGTIIAVDPLSWAHGFRDDFEIDASEHAIVHMNDEPAEIVSDVPTVADPVRSLWQTDAMALRLLCEVAFAPRRPNAVAWAQALTW